MGVAKRHGALIGRACAMFTAALFAMAICFQLAWADEMGGTAVDGDCEQPMTVGEADVLDEADSPT